MRISGQPITLQESPSGIELQETRVISDARLRGRFDNYNADQVDYTTQDYGNGKSYSQATFEVGNKLYQLKILNDWTIDLGSTGIDTDAKTGGLVDGLAKENSRGYLVWAFLDNNFNFLGLGATRKPYAPFTSITGGNKGSTATLTGVTDAYQLTIGSRVCVRNKKTNVEVAPLYEWNWGTLIEIANSGSVTIDLDNNSYGTNLGTTSTFEEILQWDRFRPWVVGVSGQELYAPYYCLLGELYTDSSGDIVAGYRADDEWRYENNLTATNFGNELYIGGDTATTTIYCGRYIPLWSSEANFTVRHNNNVGYSTVSNMFGNVITELGSNRAFGTIKLLNNASVNYSRTGGGAANSLLYTFGYRIPGGMRG